MGEKKNQNQNKQTKQKHIIFYYCTVTAENM